MKMAPSEDIEKPPNKPKHSEHNLESNLVKTRQKYKQLSKVGSLNNSSIVSALDAYITNKSAKGAHFNFSKPGFSKYESKYKNAMNSKESETKMLKSSNNVSLLQSSIKNLKEAARKNQRIVKH